MTESASSPFPRGRAGGAPRPPGSPGRTRTSRRCRPRRSSRSSSGSSCARAATDGVYRAASFAFPGFDRFAFGLSIADAWARAGHPRGREPLPRGQLDALRRRRVPDRRRGGRRDVVRRTLRLRLVPRRARRRRHDAPADGRSPGAQGPRPRRGGVHGDRLHAGGGRQARVALLADARARRGRRCVAPGVPRHRRRPRRGRRRPALGRRSATAVGRALRRDTARCSTRSRRSTATATATRSAGSGSPRRSARPSTRGTSLRTSTRASARCRSRTSSGPRCRRAGRARRCSCRASTHTSTTRRRADTTGRTRGRRSGAIARRLCAEGAVADMAQIRAHLEHRVATHPGEDYASTSPNRRSARGT